jgi:DNA-directed RNA polymerase specialized sigma24 family protein
MELENDGRFYAGVWPRLRSFLKRRYPGFSREQVEDCIQITFLRFIRYRRDHEVPKPLALLYLIAGRVAASECRSQGRMVLVGGGDEEELLDRLPSPEPAREWDGVEAGARLVVEWLRRNRSEDALLVLDRLRGLSYEEIARGTGRRPEAVRKRFSRLCDAVRQAEVVGLDECLSAWNQERARA